MSFWDDLSNIYSGVTEGDWSKAGAALGQAWDDGTSAVKDFVSSPSDVVGSAPNTASTAADIAGSASNIVAPLASASQEWGGFTPGLGYTGSYAKNLGSIGDFAPGQGMTGLVSRDVIAPMAGAFEATPSSLAVPLAADSGIAASGGADMMGAVKNGASKAYDWAKNNPELLNTGVQAGLQLLHKTAPTQASEKIAGLADQGNASGKAIADEKSNVGRSLINNASFNANNAEAASKGASAASSNALKERMQQQGYRPGDAQYDSAMQQQGIGNAGNEATAYAAGQGQVANQMNTGAGLLTAYKPDTTGYDKLNDQQTGQQVANNAKTDALGTLATTAFDIYANSDKKPAKAG
jgi:hypothetical protein